MPIKFLLTGSYCLDMFSPHSLVYQGEVYPTAEHLYMSLKFSDPQIVSEIRVAISPVQAKEIARKYRSERIDNWEEIKVEKMELVLNLKFFQHPEIQDYLKSTGIEELIEANPEDYFWGCGADGTGQNHIGKIWIKIRKEKLGL